MPLRTVILAVMMFFGTWSFNYGYDIEYSKNDQGVYFAPREISVHEMLITFSEDGTAVLRMEEDGIVEYGTWTNTDGLEEYRVEFPGIEKAFTMTIGLEDARFESGMLILTDETSEYCRRYYFDPVWHCEQCGSDNLTRYSFCPYCGTAKP